MTDPSYVDSSWLLRAPDLRMIGMTYEIARSKPPFELAFDRPSRVFFYYLRSGRLRLTTEAAPNQSYEIGPGTSVGLEQGGNHRWVSIDSSGDDIELFISTADRRYAVLRHLPNAIIIVPPTARPFATILDHCVAGLEADIVRARSDEAVSRRFCEIIQIELVRYSESLVEQIAPMPEGVRHDRALLRAWTAFFSDPSRHWTVAGLATAAGISRTAFSERFHRIVGSSPIETLTRLRIHYAANMLRTTRAPLVEIALSVGYGSEESFMRAFRREFGTTPGRWRATEMPASVNEVHADEGRKIHDISTAILLNRER